nr:hypothetical protein D0Y65_031416 [Ipomoea batatas]
MSSSQELISTHPRKRGDLHRSGGVQGEDPGAPLREINMPSGLPPTRRHLGGGSNPETGNGFVWLKQKEAKEHKFKKIGETRVVRQRDVPDSAVIIRKHSTATNLFSCLVFNEAEAFNPRDQLAFAFVRDMMNPKLKLNMFDVEVFEQVTVEYRHNHEGGSGGASGKLELISTHRENAEIYTDPAVCKEKTLELLREINMPSGLLPLDDILEVGRNPETGNRVRVAEAKEGEGAQVQEDRETRVVRQRGHRLRGGAADETRDRREVQGAPHLGYSLLHLHSTPKPEKSCLLHPPASLGPTPSRLSKQRKKPTRNEFSGVGGVFRETNKLY